MPNPQRASRIWSLALWGLVVALVLVLGLPSKAVLQVTGTTSKTDPQIDPLVDLNNSSRALYAQAKATALSLAGPVLILVGDDLILRSGEKRIQARYIPDIYHTLKSFSHVPMAIDAAMSAHASESRLSDEFLAELRDYRSRFPAAQERIPSAGLDAELRERQKAILAASASFLDSVIDTRQCRTEDRVAYARRMNPLILANGSAAARAALDSLHHQVCERKKELSAEEWNRLTVLVMGRKLPRKDNLAVQYFARLLGQPGEGSRIIYAESLVEEPRALDLLATLRVDTLIGTDFFNDPLRMHRDLLGDATREYVSLLIDRPGEACKP